MKTKSSARTIAQCALAAALIAVGAFIKIPMPFGLSMTLQVFFVILCGFLIGKSASLAALAYMVIGLAGLPVFTQGGGISYVLQPSFGYIIAFVPAGWILGSMTKDENCTFKKYMFAAVCAIILVYIIGITYFSLIYGLYMDKTVTARLIFVSLFLTFIWKDVLVAVIAALIALRIRRLVRR